MIRMTHVSARFKQFGIVLSSLTLQDKQIISPFSENIKSICTCSKNRTEGSLSYLFLKLTQINNILSDIVYVSEFVIVSADSPS